MNTGIQDAFNLAWKLALVAHGIGDEDILLGSFSPERSAIAEQVLKGSGKATEIALLQGEFRQSIRNSVAGLLLGLSPVKKKIADVLTEVSISYPDSPLNDHLLNGGAAHRGAAPAEGERAPIREAEKPVGAGDTPRFAVFAEESNGRGSELIAKYSRLLEPVLREPIHKGGIWLVRPDGYVGLAAGLNGWEKVAKYLDRISPSSQAE